MQGLGIINKIQPVARIIHELEMCTIFDTEQSNLMSNLEGKQ